MAYQLIEDEDDPRNDSGMSEYEEWYFSDEQKLKRINEALRLFSTSSGLLRYTED